MKIIEKLSKKNADLYGAEPVTIAFLGDSVTNGCFELYMVSESSFDTVFERGASYSARLSQMLSRLYPRAQLNIVNAGISGDCAPNGFGRLERDVLRFHPDLTVVCYGLNDCMQGDEAIDKYTDALRAIFKTLEKEGSEVVFMTPNLMNDTVSPQIQSPIIRACAEKTCGIMNGGTFDRYMDAARGVARESGVKICDCSARWKRLKAAGVDTTALLSNFINHPSREMHDLFAVSLLETFFEE